MFLRYRVGVWFDACLSTCGEEKPIGEDGVVENVADLFSRYKLTVVDWWGKRTEYLLSLAEHVCSKKGNVV